VSRVLRWRAKFRFLEIQQRTKGSNVAEVQKTRKPQKAPKESLWDPVYKLVKQIPRGRVLSYGALAKALRLRGGARSAGRAMAATPQGHGIPWHRVLAANGRIVIRGEHALLQRKLLESEGIPVLESRVKITDHLWTPLRTKTAKKPSTTRKRSRNKTPRERKK
jgi:methylated-DNA-protein-cysteine methyltransferase related protein